MGRGELAGNELLLTPTDSCVAITVRDGNWLECSDRLFRRTWLLRGLPHDVCIIHVWHC